MKTLPCTKYLAMAVALCVAPISQGALLFYQGFDYGSTGGDLTTIASSDWTSSATLTPNYTTSGLSYGNLAVSGGAAQTQSTWTSSVNTATQNFADIDISAKSEVWISFLMEAPASVTSNASALFGANITRNSWQTAVNYTAGTTYGSNTSYMANPGANAIPDGTFAANGTDTVLVVFKLTSGANTEVWLNPSISSTAPVAGTGLDIGSAGNLTSINSIALSFQGQSFLFDELRIGDTFLDVTPSNIPEPSATAMLLGGSALGLCVLRRRRR